MKPIDPLIYGLGRIPDPALKLQAGPLTMFFDRDGAFLRNIRLEKTETLRGIYVAVRNQDWDTVPGRIEQLQATVESNCFRLLFDVSCREGAVDFVWHGEIVGTTDGLITYSFDGEARSDFLRNRIGFCLLHPLELCAGRPCIVGHVDGSIEHGVFPRLVSPYQPFRAIRSIRHKVSPSREIEVRFEGEVFEMEDQRNWTDSSFKTYCTPLSLPFPVRIDKGTHLSQRVSVRVINGEEIPLPHSRSASLPHPAGVPEKTMALPAHPDLLLPFLGLGTASHGRPLSPREAEKLKRLQIRHLRSEIRFAHSAWREVFKQAVRDAVMLDCSLQLALCFYRDPAEELRHLASEMDTCSAPASLAMLFDSSGKPVPEWIDAAKNLLVPFHPDMQFATGVLANFAELNRQRPPAGVIPCFSLNPQVHASDPHSMMENLEAQAHVVRTAHEFSGTQVVVSPISLKPRFNAVATSPPLSPQPDALPPEVDVRQLSLFAAAWTLGSMVALSGTGLVHSLTYYETTGWRGLMETEIGSPLPDLFPSHPGRIFPLFFVFFALAGFDRIARLANANESLAGMAAFDRRGNRRILLANLAGEEKVVELSCQSGSERVWILEPENVAVAVASPEKFMARPTHRLNSNRGKVRLELGPYSLAWLDTSG